MLRGKAEARGENLRKTPARSAPYRDKPSAGCAPGLYAAGGRGGSRALREPRLFYSRALVPTFLHGAPFFLRCRGILICADASKNAVRPRVGGAAGHEQRSRVVCEIGYGMGYIARLIR